MKEPEETHDRSTLSCTVLRVCMSTRMNERQIEHVLTVSTAQSTNTHADMNGGGWWGGETGNGNEDVNEDVDVNENTPFLPPHGTRGIG